MIMILHNLNPLKHYPMKIKLLSIALTACIFAISSCQKTELLPAEKLNQPAIQLKKSLSGFAADCIPTQAILLSEASTVVGSITVSNADKDNIYVTYTCDNSWALAKTALYAGDCELIPIGVDGTPDLDNYPNITTHSNFETSYTYIIPVSNIPRGTCGCISAHAMLVNTAGTNEVLSAWGVIKTIVSDGSEKSSYSFNYCSCN